MCIGLTGEGIRPALFFGEACGGIVREIMASKLTLEDGLAKYAAYVDSRRKFFQVFSSSQSILTRLPTPWIDTVMRVGNHGKILSWVFGQYLSLTHEWDQ
jgi:hypothetical protein